MYRSLFHKIVPATKRLLYNTRGEPYRIRGRTLRYVPGTRPVRLRYTTSPDPVSRYDAMQLQLFAKSVFEGDTIIDVGAHAGQYAILLAALCGKSGQVIAFEPDPHARELLERNLALNPTIKRPVVESYAVSDSSGEAVLFSRRGDSQSSLVKAGVKQAPSALETIRVSLVTLDSYLSQNGLPAPRWLKIDAEGAEIRILRGAGEVLRGATKIVCELHPYAWSEFGNTLAELKELASQSGRKIRYLDQNSEIVNEARYGAVILEKK